MKILLLSAYDAHSHRYWRSLLEQRLADYHWTQLVLPPRYFNWRIRGNALSWALSQQATLQARYDLLLATSMVDLATLKGLVPSLGTVPSILYCHENQFAYPATAPQQQRIEPQMVTLYAGLAATRVVFNSDYNRETYLDGVAALLKKLPDAVPAEVPELLARKSEVLPVPIAMPAADAARTNASGEFHIVWNHRWEYDKGPEQLLAALQRLPQHLPLRFHIVGQQFRSQPAVFRELKALLMARDWLGDWGYIEARHAYFERLGACHAVLSTSLHDFQGLAVLEAVARGCIPIVPDRLAYRELFSENFRYKAFGAPVADGAASAEEATACAAAIVALIITWQKSALPPVPDISGLSWEVLESSYRRLIENTCAVSTNASSAVTIPSLSE